jgi:3-methyladenine DNA glycosylase Mpg
LDHNNDGDLGIARPSAPRTVEAHVSDLVEGPPKLTKAPTLPLTRVFLLRRHGSTLRLDTSSDERPMGSSSLPPTAQDVREVPTCHTQFWKANRTRTMYVPGSETHVHNNYIIGHHHTLLKVNSGKLLLLQ